MTINHKPLLWWLTTDWDLTCLDLYARHYSATPPGRGRPRHHFLGPGEKLVLRTREGDAVFGWCKFLDASGQTGVNCAVFRNESAHRSSLLIEQADAVADCIWPDSRRYTYVNPKKVRSTNPGFCFLQAGWRKCGYSKSGLLILEIMPNARSNDTAHQDRAEAARLALAQMK